MPVILGEASILAAPLSRVRIGELLFGCLAFSLVASLGTQPSADPRFANIRHFCMFTWCVFFVLTLLILLVEFVQFQSLLPISWKNLPITVAMLATPMCLTSFLGLLWLVVEGRREPAAVTATMSSCLAGLAYNWEAILLRSQSIEQRGYMATIPGLLKALQVFGGCVMFFLARDHYQSVGTQSPAGPEWLFWLSLGIKVLCFLMSMGTVLVLLGDCASQCPMPFHRLLAGFCLLAVLLYMVVTLHCFTKILGIQTETSWQIANYTTETVTACSTLLVYTLDLAFCVKLLCDRC